MVFKRGAFVGDMPALLFGRPLVRGAAGKRLR
jgi:hypothetical protein